MKRILLIISCCLAMVAGLNAQTLEQKKICALKWTLQQAFYNKSEGQQIAHLDVTEFKSFSDFQKNKTVSAAIKKITDTTEQNRVSRIIKATSASDVDSNVPSSASKEYKADVEKIKTQGSTTSEETEEENSETQEQAEEQKPANETPDIQTVEEAAENEATEQPAEQPAEEATDDSTEGMTFWEVVLISFGLYLILTVCLLLFLRSRKNMRKTEETVSMEQYRSERLRLIERIKAMEIELDNVKAARQEKKPNNAHVAPKPAAEDVKPAVAAEVTEPAKKESGVSSATAATATSSATATSETHNPVSQSLFGDNDATVAPAKPKAPAEPVKHPRPKNYSAVMFFPVPVDGVFMNGSSEIEVGTSLYMLKTNDDATATFQILNTPEAISSALVSMDTMVKPACKILNTVSAPVEILAEKLGTAEKVGDGWKITNKAVVRLI